MTDAAKAPRERPMSPHLQVWRWHITMATSIIHRASIFALYLSALLVTGWALSLAIGPDAYFAYAQVLTSPLGLLVLFGLTLMLFYNLAYNIRQAFWDMGHGFVLQTANATSMVIIAFAVAATVALWAGLFMLGVFA